MGLARLLGKAVLAPVKVVTYPIAHPFKTVRVVSYPVRHPFQTLLMAGLAFYGLSYCSQQEVAHKKEPSQLEKRIESDMTNIQNEISLKLYDQERENAMQRSYWNN